MRRAWSRRRRCRTGRYSSGRSAPWSIFEAAHPDGDLVDTSSHQARNLRRDDCNGCFRPALTGRLAADVTRVTRHKEKSDLPASLSVRLGGLCILCIRGFFTGLLHFVTEANGAAARAAVRNRSTAPCRLAQRTACSSGDRGVVVRTVCGLAAICRWWTCLSTPAQITALREWPRQRNVHPVVRDQLVHAVPARLPAAGRRLDTGVAG